MAASKKRASRSISKTSRSISNDAVTLLKADHRQVEKLFKDFERASPNRKKDVALKICQALRVHTMIEEEIFYPAFLGQAHQEEIHHEAEVEHAGAKKLISQIERGDPEDEYFEAKVSVLSEMIKHHVKEEEKPGGMFTKAKTANMDLKDLGQQLAERKAELESSTERGVDISIGGPRPELDSIILTA